MATRRRKVRLTPEGYELLRREAERRGIDADDLADELVRRRLEAPKGDELEGALRDLAELRAGLPEIDGVALAREARDELDRRPG